MFLGDQAGAAEAGEALRHDEGANGLFLVEVGPAGAPGKAPLPRVVPWATRALASRRPRRSPGSPILPA